MTFLIRFLCDESFNKSIKFRLFMACYSFAFYSGIKVYINLNNGSASCSIISSLAFNVCICSEESPCMICS